MLVSCYSKPGLNPVSVDELHIMQSRLEASPLESSWEALDLVAGISTNTLRVLGNFTELSLLPVDLQVKIETMKSLGIELLPNGVVVLAEPPLLKMKNSEILSPLYGPSLEALYRSIVDSRDVWTIEYLGGRERIKHFCANQCACLSDKISQILPIDKTLILQVNGYGGTSVRTSKNLVLDFGYHVATAIHIEDIGWGVIDPIMYGDAKIHSISDWRSRLLKTKDLRVSVYLPVRN